MTPEIYKEELKKLKDEVEAKKKLLAKTYAFSNNPYKIGDKITDYSNTIIIDEIRYTMGFHDDPSCVYIGVILNKDGKPNKKGTTAHIYQSNIGK